MEKNHLWVTIVVSLAISLGIVGCTKAPGDTQIASDIQNKLNADSGLQGKQLVVQATNGTVTLSGTVDTQAERDAASKYASSEPGVKQVVNNLEVGASASQPPMPMAETAPMPVPAPKEEKPTPSSRRRHHHDEAFNNNRDSNRMNSGNNRNMQSAQGTQSPMDSNSANANPGPQTPPPPPQKVTIPSGTTLSVRLVDPIDSGTSQEGDTFHATLNSPLTMEGETVVPAGYDVEGHVATVHSAGKFAGQSLVILQLDRIKVGAKRYDIQTNQYEKKASSRSTNTAEKVGGGAVLGAIIGGLAGGGKGAGIGAAAGAGLGGGVQAATKSKQIKLPSETVLNFTLQSSLTVIPTTQGPNADRQRLDNNQ